MSEKNTTRSSVKIILSLDYELFGDGSGSVLDQQIKPTNALIDIVDAEGAKLTIFSEYGQIDFFQRFKSESAEFVINAEGIENQLRRLVGLGHDVQMHYHPTWYDARLINGKPSLDLKTFDITALSDDRVFEVLRSGKCYYEQLLCPVNEDYQCIAFRAGAWSANEPGRLIDALVRAGYRVDSSVAMSAHLDSGYGKFDYRGAHPNWPYWKVSSAASSLLQSDDLIEKTKAIVEVPIFSVATRTAVLTHLKRQARLTRASVKADYSHKVVDKNSSRLQKIKKVIDRDFLMFDFNILNSSDMLKMLGRAQRDAARCGALENVPVMLIGHSKSSYHLDELARFLSKASNMEDVEFSTLQSFYEGIL